MDKMVLEFLADLSANNDREWFQANRVRYDKARLAVEQFVNQLIPLLGSFDEKVKYLQAKDCMFRIFRDVRFSANKAPYKTNMGAWITHAGRKSSGPGYYLHLQPGGSFLAAGVYMPDPDQLKRLRKEVYYHTDKFLKLLHDPALRRYFGDLDEMDKAKLAPRDFPKDFQHIELLKHRHYIVSAPLTDEQVTSDDFLNFVHQAFHSACPFNSFLKSGLDG